LTDTQIDRHETGLRITLRDSLPSVRYDAEKERFQVSFKPGDQEELIALLTPAALQALALQCLALMPEIEPKYTVASVEEAFRLPAKVFKLYDDLSIQRFLREVQMETLIDFLWYLKDRELIMKVVNNLSSRAAECLVQDMDKTWHGKNPDTAIEHDARRGRAAVMAVMTILQRLIDEGSVPDILGNQARLKQNKATHGELTVEEVDDLLTGGPNIGEQA